MCSEYKYIFNVLTAISLTFFFHSYLLPIFLKAIHMWEKARVGCFERTALKHVCYLG